MSVVQSLGLGSLSPRGDTRERFSLGGILVVDDSAQLRDLARHALADSGHPITTAASGDEALALLKARSFALVLSDYAMPEGDGLTLLAAVRPLHPELPFILWSSALPEDVCRRAAALGAVVRGSKPVGDELAALVDVTLPRHD